MSSRVNEYSVPQETTEGINEAGETVIDYPKFSQWYAYYNRIPHFQTPINNFVDFVIGMGVGTDDDTKGILNGIRGMGEDSFNSFMFNHLVVEIFNGDAFAEIIRHPKTNMLLNLKSLDPSSMRTILNKKGMIVRYDKEAQAVYIKVADTPSSFGIVDHTQEITDMVAIDWMKDGTLYGVEILGVDKVEYANP